MDVDDFESINPQRSHHSISNTHAPQIKDESYDLEIIIEKVIPSNQTSDSSDSKSNILKKLNEKCNVATVEQNYILTASPQSILTNEGLSTLSEQKNSLPAHPQRYVSLTVILILICIYLLFFSS